MDLGMILQLLIMACGVYMMYWAVQMNMSKKIPTMLVGKSFPISRAKDPDGFIRFTFPFTLGTGIILFVAGALGALDIFAPYPVLDTVVSFVVIIVVVIYGAILMKAQKKYLVGIEQ